MNVMSYSYQRERDEFIAKATKEGLELGLILKLLRYATTLHRLVEAQCDGDWPYNGDCDRPRCFCAFDDRGHDEECLEEKARYDAKYMICPQCQATGVDKNAMRKKVCPNCRTQELVERLLRQSRCLAVAVFNGDPRGAVLRLSTLSYPYADNGSNGAYGLYVPARVR
jgi:hypothetical protein